MSLLVETVRTAGPESNADQNGTIAEHLSELNTRLMQFSHAERQQSARDKGGRNKIADAIGIHEVGLAESYRAEYIRMPLSPGRRENTVILYSPEGEPIRKLRWDSQNPGTSSVDFTVEDIQLLTEITTAFEMTRGGHGEA